MAVLGSGVAVALGVAVCEGTVVLVGVAGIGVAVAVLVAVGVAVAGTAVGVFVGAAVGAIGVGVLVAVGVLVGVAVQVLVGVAVGVIGVGVAVGEPEPAPESLANEKIQFSRFVYPLAAIPIGSDGKVNARLVEVIADHASFGLLEFLILPSIKMVPGTGQYPEPPVPVTQQVFVVVQSLCFPVFVTTSFTIRVSCGYLFQGRAPTSELSDVSN